MKKYEMIKNFIINMLYRVLYLDILISEIWKVIVHLWSLGGLIRLAVPFLLALIVLIITVPIISFIWLIKKIYFISRDFIKNKKKENINT